MINLSKQQSINMHGMLIRQTGGLEGLRDGNKRIGILAMLTFMELNGMQVQCTDNDLIDLGLSVASGISGRKEILDWIMSHS